MRTLTPLILAASAWASGGASMAASEAPALAGWSAGLIDGDAVARLDSARHCPRAAALEWSPLLAQRVGAELTAAFDAELTRHAQKHPQWAGLSGLEVRAFVNDVEMLVCPAGRASWQGGFRVQLSWTVQQPGTNRVLYQGSTTGAYLAADAQTDRAASGLRRAMAQAVDNLLADRRFTAATWTTPSLDSRVALAPTRIR